MARNISDRNGRALEYILVEEFQKKYYVRLTKRAKSAQRRDLPKFRELNSELKRKFNDSSSKISRWVNKRYEITSDTVLDRVPDNEAKKGDKTDLRLNYPSGKEINLSIKHNHNAVKHQRPSALPQQCGFPKGEKVDKDYRNKYQSITKDFLQRAEALCPDANKFKQLKYIDKEFIDTNLYQPVCGLTEIFLNTHRSKQGFARTFFEFIVGTIDFYKIMVKENQIEILSYADIELPNNLKAKIREDKNNYVDVSFPNGWELAMRLHTASSSISGVSLKYDTRVTECPIPLVATIGIS